MIELPSQNPRYTALLEQRRQELRAGWQRELPDVADLVLEIGCGHGHFLTAYAQRHPDRVCVGIDLDTERIRRAVRKRERAGLANLHFFQAEAQLFLDIVPPGVRFTDVYLLFPDPWPKARHHKHRIIRPGFLTPLAARMTTEAHLFFRTDYLPYFADAEQTLHAHPLWNVSKHVWEFEYETVFQQRAESHHSLIAQVQRPA